MPHYIDRLIDQATGEINMPELQLVAKERADFQAGGEASPSWVRSETENLKTIAYFQRRDWRKRHGLADDTVYVESWNV